MKCTSCKNGELTPSFIDGQFRAHTCSNCGGNWILIEDYVTWKERNPQFSFDESVLCEIEDSKTALLCPATGTICFCHLSCCNDQICLCIFLRNYP